MAEFNVNVTVTEFSEDGDWTVKRDRILPPFKISGEDEYEARKNAFLVLNPFGDDIIKGRDFNVTLANIHPDIEPMPNWELELLSSTNEKYCEYGYQDCNCSD